MTLRGISNSRDTDMGKDLSTLPLDELWQLFPIIIRDHDPVWEKWYREESRLLAGLFPEDIVRLSHIGSTSVKGLPAKPTVDLLLEITSGCHLGRLRASLEKNDYIYSPQRKKPAPHMMFMKGYTEEGFVPPVYHLHVRYPGDWDELYFRDYLRVHDDITTQYGMLKKQLAQKYAHNRDAYTYAKTEFIQSHTKAARREFPGRY